MTEDRGSGALGVSTSYALERGRAVRQWRRIAILLGSDGNGLTMTKREDAYIGAPWSADRHHVVNVSGYLVARASGIAEAARIAAAVTACDGIPLAELEAGIIRELIDT